MSVNKVILIGNVGKDPIVRYVNQETPVANFSLATHEIYKDNSGNNQKITEWHNIVAWRALAQFAEKYIKKGTQLYIEGKIRSRSYNDKDNQPRYVYEIYAEKIQLLGRKEDAPTDTNTANTSERTLESPEENIDINETLNEPDGNDLPF
jgi:single-strand DNA-binding protein